MVETTHSTPGHQAAGERRLEEDAKAAAAAARSGAEQAGAAARQQAGELAGQARHLGNEAMQGARDAAREQKDAAAGQIKGVAQAMRSAADDLGRQDQDSIAGYARQAASGLEQFAHSLEGRSLGDMVHAVEDFARRQPVAFLGGAVATGFLLSRFAKSSAERDHADDLGERHPRGFERMRGQRHAAPAGTVHDPLSPGTPGVAGSGAATELNRHYGTGRPDADPTPDPARAQPGQTSKETL